MLCLFFLCSQVAKISKIAGLTVELTYFFLIYPPSQNSASFCTPAVSSCIWRTKVTWRWRCLRRQPKVIRPGTAWGHQRPLQGTLGSFVCCRASQRVETPRSCSSLQSCPPDSASSTLRASSPSDRRMGMTTERVSAPAWWFIDKISQLEM